jgi:carbon monoxide dehydrogenase subunit G
MRLEKTIKINCAPEQAFAFASDFNNASKWMVGLVESKTLSEGAVGLGATYVVSMKMLGQTLEMKCEVTAWEPPARYEYKGVAAPFPIAGGFSFHATEDGGTFVTLVNEVEPGSFFKMAGSFLQTQIEKLLNDTLQALKKALEN